MIREKDEESPKIELKISIVILIPFPIREYENVQKYAFNSRLQHEIKFVHYLLCYELNYYFWHQILWSKENLNFYGIFHDFSRSANKPIKICFTLLNI